MSRRNTHVLAAYLAALRSGLSPKEAGNLTAVLYGIKVRHPQGWTVDQIEHALFLRALEERDHPDHQHTGEADVPDA